METLKNQQKYVKICYEATANIQTIDFGWWIVGIRCSLYLLFHQVLFEEVLAEPAGAHSTDCCWRWSFMCFTGSKNCCYKILTFLCSWAIAFVWGCQLAAILFVHVWIMTPLRRSIAFVLDPLRRMWGTSIVCCLGPLCVITGLLFKQIKVKNVS